MNDDNSDPVEDYTYIPKSNLEDYPVNKEFYKVLDALDIKKTKQTWIALLKCDSKYGIKTRFYKWKWKQNDGKWGVDWARMDIDGWNMDHIQKFLSKIEE